MSCHVSSCFLLTSTVHNHEYLAQADAHGSLVLPPPWSDDGGGTFLWPNGPHPPSSQVKLECDLRFTVPPPSQPVSGSPTSQRFQAGIFPSDMVHFDSCLPKTYMYSFHLLFDDIISNFFSKVLQLLTLSFGLTASSFTTKQVTLWESQDQKFLNFGPAQDCPNFTRSTAVRRRRQATSTGRFTFASWHQLD